MSPSIKQVRDWSVVVDGIWKSPYFPVNRWSHMEGVWVGGVQSGVGEVRGV